MAKQNLLLVDADLRSVRVLEVSLRKAGYNVASAPSARDALAMLELSRPDLVLCDTRLPDMDGFALIEELRGRPELAGTPLMILSSDVSVETKVRGLELGVEDYLTKPVYIKELLARVNIALQRKRREGIERLEPEHKRKFSGSLSDMGVVDLLQAIDHNKKSGVLYLASGSFDGAIYFCNGAPVDAAVGRLRGPRAIYRTLLWTEGTFEVDFREIDREDQVQTSMQTVLMEGLRRVDEWGRLLEQLPDLHTVFEVSDTQLMARLAEIPDQINSVLREFDGERSLWQIVDACDAEDLETLGAVAKLYFEGFLYNTGRRGRDREPHDDDPSRLAELNEMAMPHISSGPPVITHTLAPAWPSVPTESDTDLQQLDDRLQLDIPATPKIPEGLRDKPSDAPKRRKGRKRKKRSGLSDPAADTQSAPPSATATEPAEPEVRQVDETIAEITPSTIAPPPEEAANVALVQAEPAEPPATIPATSQPPKLPRSSPASTRADITPDAEQNDPSEVQQHDNETLDLAPVLGAVTPPPLRSSARPSWKVAPEEEVAPGHTLASTTPPPPDMESEPSTEAAAEDLHTDDETTEPQLSLHPSAPPSVQPQEAVAPSPLPYVSKPPSLGVGSHRGVTSPGFAAAPRDEAEGSDAETAPPPFAEQRSASDSGGPRASQAPISAAPLRGPSAPAMPSQPARDFEAAVLAAASSPPPESLPSEEPVVAPLSAAASDADEPLESDEGLGDIASVTPSAPAIEPQEPPRVELPSVAADDAPSMAMSSEAAPPEPSLPPVDSESEMDSPVEVAAVSVPDRAAETEADDTTTPALPSAEPAASWQAAPMHDLSPPALAEPSVPPSSQPDDAGFPEQDVATASLQALGSSAPANDVGTADSAPAKPEEDFSELDVSAEPTSARASAASAPPGGPQSSSAPRARSSPPPLPASRSRAPSSSPPSYAASPATESPPIAADNSHMASVSSDSDSAAAARDTALTSSNKHVRPPIQPTAVPPPFAPAGQLALEAEDGNRSGPQADRELGGGIALATNTTPPLIAPVTRSTAPEAMAHTGSVREATESIAAPVSTQRPPSGTASTEPPATASAAAEALAAGLKSGAPHESKRPKDVSNVISFVPRKRADDAAPAASSTPAAPPQPSSSHAPSKSVWSNSSAAPRSTQESGAPSQPAPQAKRRMSRWVQAGGAAAAVALATGLFALQMRDAAPQGSLITAVPEQVEAASAAQPTTALEAEQQAHGEPEATQAKGAPTPPETAPATEAKPASAEEEKSEATGTAQAEPAAAPSANVEAATQAPATAEQKPPSDQPQAQNPAQVLATGLRLEQRGKKQDAINLYAKAVEGGAGSSQLLSRMAFLYLNQGKNALASSHAERAAAADETNSEAWIVLGAAQDQLGKKQAAQQAYRSCAQKGQGQYVTECKRMLR